MQALISGQEAHNRKEYEAAHVIPPLPHWPSSRCGESPDVGEPQRDAAFKSSCVSAVQTGWQMWLWGCCCWCLFFGWWLNAPVSLQSLICWGCLSDFLFVGLSVSLCLSAVWMSVCWSVCWSVCLLVVMSFYLSACLSFSASVCLSMGHSVRQSVCLSVHLSVCLRVKPHFERRLRSVIWSSATMCVDSDPDSLSDLLKIRTRKTQMYLTLSR